MMVFWILVLAMIVVAVAFTLWPLFRGRSESRAARIRAHSNLAIFEDRLAELEADRDEGRVDATEFDVLRAELERSLLGDVDDLDDDGGPDPSAADRGLGGPVLVGGAVLVPLLALVLYADWGLSLGFQDELALAREMREVEGLAGTGHDSRQVDQLISRLESRLSSNPDDADGWFLLGRTALNQGAFERAATAFGRVGELLPDEPGPMVFQAQSLYLAEDRQVTPRVRGVIDRVLELVPGQPIMLEILGMDAFQNARFAEAADLFEQVLATGIPEGERRAFLQDGLQRSRELAGLPTPLPEAQGEGIQVQVQIADAVLRDLPSNAAVFVMARPVGGPPMPLAVQRLRPASRLDVRLTLDDAMAPDMALDSVEEVEIIARLSRAGTAERGPGDLERTSPPVATRGAAPVELWLGASEPPAAARAEPEPLPSVAPAAGGRVQALVEVSPEVGVPPGSTLYVFALEVDGPPAPLAVSRHRADELPLLVALDDSMTMTPERPLSAASRVQIIARVSADGGVAARPGDLEGVSVTLDPRNSSRVVNVLIDRVIQ
ncbi:MAG: c-type cytochrome biogenesis protein CcmI [Gammaproteobacteria bacterium]|nr:MAG: c-type cytochrome biogenesis protein CcmI [Gammaproteobacteria bacterium]